MISTVSVELKNVTLGYASRAIVRVEALTLRAGECLGVFGPNGAGKTTLVRGIVGLLAPMAGTISRESIRIGYLPQHRSMELHWPMSGLDVATLAHSARRRFGFVGAPSATLDAMLDVLEVRELVTRAFAKLSGGQQQRLLLAGALAAAPQMLVLDEPTDGLDVRSRALLLRVLAEQTRAGLCTVMISHDVEDLLELADCVAWLHPAGAAEEPSHVEQIKPSALAARIMTARHIR